MEVVISVGLVAIALPLLLAAFATSSTTNRDAREDTLAAFAARGIFSEIAASRSGGSELLGNDALKFPYPSAGGRVVVIISKDGTLLRRGSEGDYTGGLANDLAAGFIATVQGVAQPNEGGADAAAAEQSTIGLMTVSIEAPAAAPATRRRAYSFHQLMRADEK